MTVQDKLRNDTISVSFEFFPPKAERGWEKLFETVSDLIPLYPSYVSITYGAGGSTRERCEFYGMEIPIIPGIMPITSRLNMRRMADLAGGVRIPAALMKAVSRADTNAYVRHVGVHWAAEQVRDLIDKGVPGIHLYTLNHSQACVEICRTLGFADFLNVPASVTAGMARSGEGSSGLFKVAAPKQA